MHIRTGFNSSSFILTTRHLYNDPYCPWCNHFETPEHILDSCYMYDDERAEFKTAILILMGRDFVNNFSWEEIILSASRVERFLRHAKFADKLNAYFKLILNFAADVFSARRLMLEM